MNVLHLPYNISNWAPIHVSNLNKINGIKAIGLIFAEKNVLHNHDQLIYVSQKNIFKKVISFFIFLKFIIWADVIHWYWDEKIFPKDIALRIIKFFKKPSIVEWLGGEIRIPEIEFRDNPFYRLEYKNFSDKPPEDLKFESLSLQKKFKKYGFDVILCPEMEQYIDRTIYPSNYSLRQRIELDKYEFVRNSNKTINIVHSPSNMQIKGTSKIIEIIEELKKKYNFNFTLIHNMPHEKAIQLVKECDIFLDQFIIGSYGMAAMEAMAMGKTVFCYLKDTLIESYPSDLPVINSNLDNLKEKLSYYIEHSDELIENGNKGRDYIQKHHDTLILIPKLLDIYQDKINKNRNNIF